MVKGKSHSCEHLDPAVSLYPSHILGKPQAVDGGGFLSSRSINPQFQLEFVRFRIRIGLIGQVCVCT